MDNLTHTLVGLASAKAGLERTSPYTTVVCLIAANLPDADIVTLGWGSLAYLKHHRGITHSIVGTLALAVAFPLIFYAAERLISRLRGREPRARLKGLLVASLLMTASHPLLDWTNSYGLRPLLPWSGEWFYGDIVFVVDPWLWLVLGGACFLLTAETNRRVALWSLLALAIVAGILFIPQRSDFEIPFALRAIWLACLAAVAFAYRAGVGERWGSRVAVVALAFVVVYWGVLAIIQRQALQRGQEFAKTLADADRSTLAKLAAMPLPMNPTRWLCIAESERATHRFVLGPATKSPEDVKVLSRHQKPQEREAAAVRDITNDPRAQIFLDFARFPVFQVNEDGAGSVRITDVRFGEPPRGQTDGGPGNFTISIPARTP